MLPFVRSGLYPPLQLNKVSGHGLSTWPPGELVPRAPPPFSVSFASVTCRLLKCGPREDPRLEGLCRDLLPTLLGCGSLCSQLTGQSLSHPGLGPTKGSRPRLEGLGNTVFLACTLDQGPPVQPAVIWSLSLLLRTESSPENCGVFWVGTCSPDFAQLYFFFNLFSF